MRLSASNHLAITIFCWLPPENAPARVHSARRSIPMRTKTRSTAADSAAPSISRPRRKRSTIGIDTLCLPLSCRNRPSVLRSSGTRLMPICARTASAGDCSTIGRPSTRSVPPCTSAIPKQARNSSSWPMPCRPATPRISPAFNENVPRLSLAPACRSVAPSTSPPRAGGVLRRVGKACASSRPAIIAMTWASSNAATGPVAMCLPLRSTVTVSQKARTSGRRCEMKITVTPRPRSVPIKSPSQSTSRPDSVEVDSSSSRIFGLRSSARAISSFCRTDRSSNVMSPSSGTSARPNEARCAATSARACERRSMPKAFTGPYGSSRLSSTLRSRTWIISWNAVWMPRR